MRKHLIILFIISCSGQTLAQIPEPIIQTGNTNEIKVITSSRDGLLYATGGADNVVILWDSKSKGQIVKFKNGNKENKGSKNYGYLTRPDAVNSAISDYEFKAFGSEIEISAIALNLLNDHIAIGNKDGKIFYWNIILKELKYVISIPENKSGSKQVSKLFFSDNGRYLFVQGSDFRIYDLSENKWVFADSKIVAFDYSLSERNLYCIKNSNGKSAVMASKISEGDSLVLKLNCVDTILTKLLYFRGKLIDNFNPLKLKFTVQNVYKMAILYGSTIRWKDKKKYFTRIPDGLPNGIALKSICFVGDNEIATCAGDLLIWNCNSGKEIEYKIQKYDGAYSIFYDERNALLLTSIGNIFQAINLNSMRVESFDDGDYNIKQMQINGNGIIYSGNQKGIRTFSYNNIPIVSNYVPGTHRYYYTSDNKHVLLTRMNKTLILDKKNNFIKQRKTDSRIILMEPIMLLVRTSFLLGGNYAIFRSNPWTTSIVNNSIYSSKYNILLFTTIKTPYGGQRIEVLDLSKLKKRKGIKCYGTKISALAISNNQKYFASAGANCVLCEKKSINIHLMEGIGSRHNKSILKIKDSAFNTVRNMAFSNTNILATATYSLKIIQKNKKKTESYEEKSIRFFDINSGQIIKEIVGQAGSMVFTKDGRKIIYSDDNNLVLYSMDSFKVMRSWSAHTDKITSVCFDSIRNQLITSSLDGSVKFWNAETWELLASLYQSKSEYILLTPDGFYTSSRLGTRAVGYGAGNRFVSFDQFDIRYNRPDIVFKRLGWFSDDVIKALNFAYKKRVGHFNLDTSGYMESLEKLPVISIHHKNDIPMEVSERNLKVVYSVTEGLDSVKWIKAELNDLPLFGSHGRSIVGGKNFSDSFFIALNQGENMIKLYAVTKGGYESLREIIKINYYPKKRGKEMQGETWTIHIGISKFADSSMNLRFAEKDAGDLYQYYHSIKNSHSFILTNKEVTRSNLKALRDTLMKTKIDDKVILTYSGHGLLSNSKDYFLSTYNIDFNNPDKEGISYDEFMGILDSIPARKKIIFLDACHSGEVDKHSDIELALGNTDSVNTELKNILPKGAKMVSIKHGRKDSSARAFGLMQQLFINLNSGNGTEVIAASAGSEYALEGMEWNNGIFTYCLLLGLKNKKADSDKNGHVDISEIKKYIIYKVPQFTRGLQTPSFRNEILRDNWQLN